MEFLELFAWMKVGDIATLSLILLIGMFFLLAIGMPLGFASAFLAVAVLVMKFGPELLFSNFEALLMRRGKQRVFFAVVFTKSGPYGVNYALCRKLPRAGRNCLPRIAAPDYAAHS